MTKRAGNRARSVRGDSAEAITPYSVAADSSNRNSFHVVSTYVRSNAEFENEIRRRPYELYEQRGSVNGYDLDDWLQAEAELLRVKRRKTAA
jgi:DUF2934 family protein